MGQKYKEALKEEFRKGLTGASAIVEALSRAVVEAGGNAEDLQCIAEKAWLQKKIATLIVDSLVSVEADGMTRVDYSLSIEESLWHAPYDVVHTEVTSAYFPTQRTGVGEPDIELICFGRAMSTGEALQKLDTMGYRPAEARELLMFGGLPERKQLMKRFPVVSAAYVESQPTPKRVLFLHTTGSLRYVGCVWFAHRWGKTARFAAVRKPKQESDSDSSHSS